MGEHNFDSGNFADAEKYFLSTLELFKSKLAPRRLSSRSSHQLEEVLQLPVRNIGAKKEIELEFH
jgi:hypothetical protein